jgi:hypothetical protein
MEFFSMEHELDEDYFHNQNTTFNGVPFNYCTVPGERWNCSKLYLFEGRGYFKDGISACGQRLYLKCRRCAKKPQPCRGRAIVTRKYILEIFGGRYFLYLLFCYFEIFASSDRFIFDFLDVFLRFSFASDVDRTRS